MCSCFSSHSDVPTHNYLPYNLSVKKNYTHKYEHIIIIIASWIGLEVGEMNKIRVQDCLELREISFLAYQI
jgi:hypothetical protein